MKTETIDHIVLSVSDLNYGIQHIEKLLGCKVSPGGRHQNFGTHNALVRIGKSSYLEIIAADPANNSFVGNRWMGTDLIGDIPRLTRWAIKSEIDQSSINFLKSYKTELGVAKSGSRVNPDGSMLSWQLTTPLAHPLIEPCPFLIKWPSRIHPSLSLPYDCKLESFTIFTPQLATIQKITTQLGSDIKVYESTSDRLEAIIRCPNGKVRIS